MGGRRGKKDRIAKFSAKTASAAKENTRKEPGEVRSFLFLAAPHHIDRYSHPSHLKVLAVIAQSQEDPGRR